MELFVQEAVVGGGVVETLLTNYLYAMSQTIEYLLGESQIPGPQKYVEY